MMQISEEKKEMIIDLLCEGYAGKEISEIVGVSQTTVSRIKNRDFPNSIDELFTPESFNEWEALNAIGREYRAKKACR